MNGTEATVRVREFFTDIHGMTAIWYFCVQELKQADGLWVVKCAFSPTYSGSEWLHYEVVIDAETGNVRSVRQYQLEAV